MQHGKAPVLKIRGLMRPGLEAADLDVAAGECVAVSGPSGAGKSLLLRAIVDLDPNQGDVALDGKKRDAMAAPEWRRRVVYVPAEAGWWAERVGEHFPDPAIAAPLVTRLGLPAAALEWEVARLSTGEKQRLALARALVMSPRALLLDEPTSGLDPETAVTVESMLHERVADGIAILIVTHDAKQAERLAKRRFRMAKGKLSPAGGGGGP
ncbi:MAG: ATP-binding cassette domain-containing protein [Rhodospirillales bacterium]|nr:ATP-binding cassette domain-containing protein [Rhodospirillales bacterium]